MTKLGNILLWETKEAELSFLNIMNSKTQGISIIAISLRFKVTNLNSII